MKPLVSIIVLTYNQESVISKTLDSLIMQETDFDYEIIVSDDCSTDNTQHVIKEYAEKYPQIVPLLNTHNRGAVGNSAFAYSHCRGQYIAYCDGDDLWTISNKLKLQVDILRNDSSIGFVYTDVLVNSIGTGQSFVRVAREPEEDLFSQMMQGCFTTTSTLCFNRDALSQYDAETIARKGFMMMDYPQLLDACACSKAYHLPLVTTSYTVDRITNTNIEKALLDSCKFAAHTLECQLYYLTKYPGKSSVDEFDCKDAYHKICYRDMIYLSRRDDALKHLKAIHKRTRYIRVLTLLLSIPCGMFLYKAYYKLKHPNMTPLSFYFGGEKIE